MVVSFLTFLPSALAVSSSRCACVSNLMPGWSACAHSCCVILSSLCIHYLVLWFSCSYAQYFFFQTTKQRAHLTSLCFPRLPRCLVSVVCICGIFYWYLAEGHCFAFLSFSLCLVCCHIHVLFFNMCLVFLIFLCPLSLPVSLLLVWPVNWWLHVLHFSSCTCYYGTGPIGCCGL